MDPNPETLAGLRLSAAAKDFVAGTLGGAAGVIVGHPFDTVKVRLQVQKSIPGQQQVYRGVLHCFYRIVRYETVFGLFKGMTSPLIGVSFINAIVFLSYGSAVRFQQSLSSTPPEYFDRATIPQAFWAGAFAGCLNSVIASPMELAKIRLQQQINPPPPPLSSLPGFRGPFDVLMATYKHSGGIPAVYRGFILTVLRETPSYAAYFAAFEYLSRKFGSARKDPASSTSSPPILTVGPIACLVAGGLAGIAGWISTYPVDVIKTRVQAQLDEVALRAARHGRPPHPNAHPPDVSFTSIRNAFSTCIRSEGPSVLVKGLGATLLRAFPTNAATFLVYTYALERMAQANHLVHANETVDTIR